MNRLVTAIAIATTLAIAQGCTQLSQEKEKLFMKSANHQNITDAMNGTSHSHHTSHGLSHADATTSTQAKLTTSGTVAFNTPASLRIDVQDENGHVIAQFERFQEQVMHLIAVSDDLHVFQHLHPIYRGNGQFEVEVQFPQSGGYTLFSDYQPTGQAEQVSVLKTHVDGNAAPTAQIDWSWTKTFGQTIVDFAPTQATIRSGEEVILRFNLQDAANHQSVNDLQPYLGEKGHLVILRQSPSLSREDYIHAHAVQNTPANQVHFATRFPQPGTYKLWGQFNRNGEIITADYWVEVQ